MIQDLAFFISEALIGMRRSGGMIVITLLTFTISLVVLGAFMLGTANLNHFSEFFASRLELRVYLKEGLTRSEIAGFKARIEKMQAVKRVQFIDKVNAWNEFKNQFNNIELGSLIDDNPLPHAFKVKLSDNEYMGAMATHLESFSDIVEDVSYLEVLSKRLSLVVRITKWAGAGLVLLLTMATLMIVVNTIRLTIIARQDEVTIMTLVGAAPYFIRWPFLIEGLLMGLISAGLAVGILKICYELLTVKVQQVMPYLPLLTGTYTIGGILVSIIVIGVGLGLLGANLSISRTLKKC